MSRRRARPDDGDALSLDSFLDIVTNVVGVLILIAVVTVLSAGDISIATSATALASTPPKAERVLFECSRNQLFFVDEEGNATKIRNLVEAAERDPTLAEPLDDDLSDEDGDAFDFEESYEHAALFRTANKVIPLLKRHKVGDANHRVRAQLVSNGLAWVYELRSDARGLTAEQIEQPDSELAQRFRRIASEGGFVYFVVHDDSFEVFRAARALARSSGVKNGWHPVEGDTPLKMSAGGHLGRRTQ